MFPGRKAAKLQAMTEEFEKMMQDFFYQPPLEYKGFEVILPQVLYLYLFEEKNLREIEEIVAGSKRLHGYLAKSLLNVVGVNTQQKNCGIFKDSGKEEVIRQLQEVGNDQALRIAYYLSMYTKPQSIQMENEEGEEHF